MFVFFPMLQEQDYICKRLLQCLIIFYAENLLKFLSFQKWNEGVALAASEWGSRCEYIGPQDKQVGQNMNYFHGDDYHKSAIDLFRASFNAWSNATLNEDNRQYRYCGQQNVCTYVQVKYSLCIQSNLC